MQASIQLVVVLLKMHFVVLALSPTERGDLQPLTADLYMRKLAERFAGMSPDLGLDVLADPDDPY